MTYLNETKIFIGVDPKVLERYGVYSKECAEAMARTVQEKLHTDIAVGITGTTGNLDLNNADSVQGRVFFCILIHDEANCFEVNADVTGMTRHEIKQMYAERVFDALDELVFLMQNKHFPLQMCGVLSPIWIRQKFRESLRNRSFTDHPVEL